MLDFALDIQQLTMIFSQATAPTFFLGAVAAFVSLMSSRLSAVVARIRALNGIPEDIHYGRISRQISIAYAVALGC